MENIDLIEKVRDGHLDESSKVTVTLGQLKRLVREWHSFDDEEESEEGGKWEVCYKDKSGDITTVWVRAHDAEEAEDKVRDEYWDVVRIVCIEKM